MLTNLDMIRQFSKLDRLLNEFDAALRTVCTPEQRAVNRVSPADDVSDITMSDSEKRHVSGLMRVNHAGEVCAQALYQGQALTAKMTTVKMQMENAAREEIDHLGWCEARLAQLKSHTSILNPLWYTGSFLLGAFAGLAGDPLSLGFVAETEYQVSTHLEKHLESIPPHDKKTKAILAQMLTDETQHAEAAVQAGASILPKAVRGLMRRMAKCLTVSSYYL